LDFSSSLNFFSSFLASDFGIGGCDGVWTKIEIHLMVNAKE